MKDVTQAVSSALVALAQDSPAGFAIALDISFTTPRLLFQTYAKDWISHYSSEGYVMSDPTVQWGFANTGMVRWSELEDNDPQKVLVQAKRFGMNFGLTVAAIHAEARTIASFSRSDREFTEDEARQIEGRLDELHKLLRQGAEFDVDALKDIRSLSVAMTQS